MATTLTNESDATSIEYIGQTESVTIPAPLNASDTLPDLELIPFESVSPISRLPVEMLREIFFHLYYSLRRRWQLKDRRYFKRVIFPLTKICRLWRTVIISIPPLWTEIDLKQTNFATLCIERSRTCPLLVQILPYSQWNRSTKELEEWRNPLLDASLATTLSQRTTELNSAIKWNDMRDFFDTLQNGGWGQLEKLYLTLYRTKDPITTTNFPSLNLSRWDNLSGIRHLSLSRFIMPFCSVFYGPNLTTVTIEGLHAVIFIDHLVAFIRDHTLLEQLSIHGISDAKLDDELEPVPRFTHEKPSLLSLKDFLDPPAMYYLFDKVFTDAYVELAYDADADFSIDPFPREHPIKQRFSLAHKMCVYLASHSLTISHCTDPENLFSTSFGFDSQTTDTINLKLQPHSRDPLIEFAEEYGSSNCTSLIIELDPFWFDDTDIEGWTTIFEHFPNLQSIRIRFNRSANATSMFEALAAGGCPNLTRIFLETVPAQTSFEVMQKYLQSLHQSGRRLLELRLSVGVIVAEDVNESDRLEAHKVRYETMLRPWVEKLEVTISPRLNCSRRW